jgi:HlyD family secretion protein
MTEAVPLPSRSRWKLAAGLVAVLLIAAVAGWRWWNGAEVNAESIERRDFVKTVVASGRVQTPHRVDVAAQITGAVLRVPVAEGQVVQADDLLIELDASEQRALLRQAEIAVVQAEARQRQLVELLLPMAEQSVRQAQAGLVNLQSMLRRQQELSAKGFIGDAALDEARKGVELADAQWRSAQMQRDTLRPGGSDRALAVAAVAQARAAADVARARIAYTLILAPVAGTLIGRHVEAGDVVQAGKLLMTLSPAGRTQLVAQIDEKNLRLLSTGQKALASADAYPAQRFEAVLAYINPGVNAQTGAVEVKLDVPAPPSVLAQDMTVSIDIEVARRANALVVPVSALEDAQGPDAQSGSVLRIEQGRAVRRPVRLGLRSAGWAEVLEGLQEGDRVVPVAAMVSPGQRVRASAAPAPAGPAGLSEPAASAASR